LRDYLKKTNLTAQEFKMVYDLHFDAIRRYLTYRSGDLDLSSDIAQDVFMKVWTKKIEITNGNIKSLLYKMAGEEFISHLRYKKVESNYLNTLDFIIINQEEDDNFYAEKKKEFKKALSELPEKQRVVFMMNKMDSLTYNEIAQSLGLSKKAIEKRMSQALSSLKINLQVS
jgi:RNA polymerase sigma-70 factor (ECF subfamily)